MDRPPTIEPAPVESLVASLRDTLGDDLVGIYLYGSAVSGGFDPGVSDLDLAVVTATRADGLDLAGLERMHRDFVQRHPEWTDRIEAVYVGRATLQSLRTSLDRLAVISPGEPFHLRDEAAADWLQNWYFVREVGLALHGPPSSEVVPPVAWPEFVAAVVRYADEISTRSLDEASPGSVAYAVLTMCRALFTVRTRALGSKQAAAAWSRARMPEWASLIDAALRCRLSRGIFGFEDEETRASAAAFVVRLAAEIRSA